MLSHCLKNGVNKTFLQKTVPKMDGQKEARKSEPADAQMEKGEEIWTFETMPSTNFFF